MEKVYRTVIDENKQYAWLAENVPEGKEMLDEEEQADFEKWLGI